MNRPASAPLSVTQPQRRSISSLPGALPWWGAQALMNMHVSDTIAKRDTTGDNFANALQSEQTSKQVASTDVEGAGMPGGEIARNIATNVMAEADIIDGIER